MSGNLRRVLSPLYVLLACSAWAQPGIITTIAGGYTGDGGPAVQAALNNPTAIALASDGTLYVADTATHRVRRVSTDGTISTFAGTGTSGYTGDGGPAARAQLNIPRGLALARDGSLYIADSLNHVIRRVDRNGNISTVAGSSRGFGGDGRSAAAARFDLPFGIAFDAKERLYVADYGNSRIRMIDESGNVSTVAGTGEAEFAGDGGLAVNAKLRRPQSVALVGDGSYFIADSQNERVRFVDADGRISTVAGGGKLVSGRDASAVGASLGWVTGVAIGKHGLYVADSVGIRLVSARGLLSGKGKLTTIVSLQSIVRRPESLVVTADETIYYSDSKLKLVGKIAGTKAFAVAGAGRPIDAISEPSGLHFGEDGSLYVADTAGAVVRRIGGDGIISTIAGNGVSGDSGDGGPALAATLSEPAGLATSGKSLYIADGFRVRVLRPDGTIGAFAGSGHPGFAGDGGPAEKAQLYSAAALLRLKDGTILVADKGRIRAVSPQGIISTFAGNGTTGFGGDGGPAINASLNPVAMAVGIDGAIFVTGNNRVRRVDPATGLIATVAGSNSYGFAGDGGPATLAHLRMPTFLAFGSDGALYISDSGNNCIRKVNQEGTISTVVGSGILGFGGDGGPAIEAKLYSPRGLAFGTDGSLYFSDWGNNRIRRVELPAPAANPPTLQPPKLKLDRERN